MVPYRPQMRRSTVAFFLFASPLPLETQIPEIPVNPSDERPTGFVFYFLGDWFDGGLTDGW